MQLCTLTYNTAYIYVNHWTSEKLQTTNSLTSLAVTPSVTRGRAKMQKTVIPKAHSEYGLWNRWPRWDDYSRVVLRGVNRKLTICGGLSISHAPCLPCLIDIISCLNCCMLTLYCLIGHLIDGRRWDTQTLATSKLRH